MNKLITVAETIGLIKKGIPLSLAGPESALSTLPAGNWIGGTIPYFMDSDVCRTVLDGKIFATDLGSIGAVQFASYGPDELAGIAAHAPANGFSLTIIPAGGRAHQRFAADAASYPGAFLKPTVGWISGVHLPDLGRVTPKVYDGRSATKHDDRAVVAYVALPAGKMTSVEIVNLFEPGGGGVLRFADTSFEVRECEVNGTPVRLVDYVMEQGLGNCHLPLVGDFAGAHVNVSMQRVDTDGGRVSLYAPVFPGVDYRFAKPVPDYAAAFRRALAEQDFSNTVVSCNCILNFLFGELEGKAIGGVGGPITFGEIAYQLLNQTLVMVRVI